ncbi:MAG: HEPN domain-containing protein [Bacteroidetes bacterium]|nr:HEPN domain-containing protein [Bacteroidota bacterium]MBU2508154.1 HEPN domain-containing protein [Bacteroidota bacterium]
MKMTEKIDLINYRKGRTFETLNEISILIENNLLFIAMNRIYYAGFYIVSALLLFDDFSSSKHKQQIVYFNKNYIRSKIISIEVGEILNKSFQKRSAADYSDYVTITKTEVIEYFEKMKIFVEEVNGIISKKISALEKIN